MSLRAEIRGVRAWAEGRIVQKLGELWGWTLVGSGTALGTGDQIATSDTTPTQTRTVRRLEPWGLRGVPMAKLRAFTIRIGSSNVVQVGLGASKGYGPTSLKQGETALYSQKVPQGVYLDQYGNNILSADFPTQKTVQVGGNAYAMPTWDPFIADVATLASTIAGLPPPTNLATALTAIQGIITAFSTFSTAITTATSYKSKKAQNG